MHFVRAGLLLAVVPLTSACLWPPSIGPCPTTTTTTAGPWAPEHQFENGVMDALGYKEGVSCFHDGGSTIKDLHDIVELYSKGGYYNRAKALAKLAGEMRMIINTLEACSAATTDAEQYARLVKNLVDPRYYTLHNALALALNVAEDRQQLEQVHNDFKMKQYYEAGKTLMRTIFDVMENPDIPSSNGTAASQIARGFASEFGQDVGLKCFKDAKVEVPSIIGGVLLCMSGAGVIPGLESVFHALVGLVPMLRDCYSEKSEIADLLREFMDFRDPLKLAQEFGHNILANGVDISIELAQTALDVKGKDYERLGQDVGKLLSKIVISKGSTASGVAVTIV